MHALPLLLVGSVLSVLLRPQINLGFIDNTYTQKKWSILMNLTDQNGFVARNAIPITIWNVLLLAQRSLSIELIAEGILFAHLWGAGPRPNRYKVKRYSKRYKSGFSFRMPPKQKTTPRIVRKGLPNPGRRKHSPKSAHKGGEVGKFKEEQLMVAKQLWEDSLKLPKRERPTLRDIAEQSGIPLGTLNKRTTGKVPWKKVHGGRRTPRVLTKGTNFCIA